jgi:hypothetical protein
MLMEGKTQEAAAAAAGMPERSARTWKEGSLPSEKKQARWWRTRPFALEDCKRDARSKPETFDFLGFTHIEGRTRAGKPTLLRRTSRKKRKAKLATLLPEIRKRRHRSVREQQRWLSSVLLGHYRYYGVPNNARALGGFFRTVENQWHRSLQRRSQRGRWSVEERRRFRQHRRLPAPTICHPWPEKRFALR